MSSSCAPRRTPLGGVCGTRPKGSKITEGESACIRPCKPPIIVARGRYKQIKVPRSKWKRQEGPNKSGPPSRAACVLHQQGDIGTETAAAAQQAQQHGSSTAAEQKQQQLHSCSCSSCTAMMVRGGFFLPRAAPFSTTPRAIRRSPGS